MLILGVGGMVFGTMASLDNTSLPLVNDHQPEILPLQRLLFMDLQLMTTNFNDSHDALDVTP